jgi:uncharacterized protein
MLHIPIRSITEAGWDMDEQVDANRLPLLSAASRDGTVCINRPVKVHIHARLAGESVLIDGRLRTGTRLECGRCLEPFDFDVEVDFSTTALPDKPVELESGAADEIELMADEVDAIVYRGDSIDLRDEIAQQIIMALPFKPLCRETCKGLCSHCGANLNRTPCQCHDKKGNSPFTVLGTLSFPRKKE